jgi:hypothetical protein
LQVKAIETVSIIEAGGVDDWTGAAGANNFAALEQLCAQRPLTIKLPRTKTGVYMFSGTTAFVDLTGVTIDADEGVSIYIQGGAGKTQFNVVGLKVKRHLQVYHENLRYSQPLAPHMIVNSYEKSGFMSALDGELHKPIKINFTTDAFNVNLTAGWPNCNLQRYVPTTIAADSVIHPAPGASMFEGTLVSVVPGDQIYAEVTTTALKPCIIVQTDSGGVIMWTDIASSGLSTMEFTGGVGTNKSTTHPVLINAAYNLDKAMVGVAIHDEKSFSLLVNGITIKRYQTVGNIRAAGWGGGFGVVPFTIANGVAFRRKRTAGVKQLRIVNVSDSTGEDATVLRSHLRYCAQFLTGMGGYQTDALLNLAVAGHTSANQLAVLLATSIAGFDYCLIRVGINDEQTAMTVPETVANMTSMVT